MLTLFDMGTLDNWSSTAHNMAYSRGIDMQPIRNINSLWYYATIIFILVGSVLCVQLFIGAITESFQKSEMQIGGLSFLSLEQREWMRTKKIIAAISPIRKYERPLNVIRGIIFDLVQNELFDLLVNAAVVVQCIALALVSFGQSDTMTNALSSINLALTIFFFAEMVLKIIGIGIIPYFHDSWNRLDCLIVVGSVGGWIYLLLTGDRSLLIINIIRLFRLIRLIRVIKGVPSLQKLISTIILTIP
eukprot:gene20354-28820_t